MDRSVGSARDWRLRLVECGQYIGRVAFGLDLLPRLCDPSLRIHEEGAPGGPLVRLAVVVLLDPGPVGLGGLVILVGEEQERQAELLAEGSLALRALGTDAPDVRAAFGDRVVGV